MNVPSFLMVLTGTGDYAYRRRDGVCVVPIGCLKNGFRHHPKKHLDRGAFCLSETGNGRKSSQHSAENSGRSDIGTRFMV